MRTSGYYWVKIKYQQFGDIHETCRWEIASWNEKYPCWIKIGDPIPYNDKYIEEVGPEVIRPKGLSS